MGINYITFNQDHTFLAVATTDGFRIYSTDPFTLCFQSPISENGASGDIAVLEMLFSTSLVALIPSPRLLRIVNTKVRLVPGVAWEPSDPGADANKKLSTICELTFPTRVSTIKLNRKRMLVVSEESIFIYDIQTMKTLHQIATPTNSYGICALSPHHENNYIAYPMRRKDHLSQPMPSHVPPSAQKTGEPMGGDVMLFDANKMQDIKVIPAHQSPLSCIAINNEGTMLATASEKGTIVRVFAIPSAQKLFQFRRGTMPARIHCMTFNATSTLLCVSSATETVHIYKLSATQSADRATNGEGSPVTSPVPASQPYSVRDRSISPGASSDQGMDASANSDLSRPTSARQPSFMSMMRKTSQTVSSSLVTRAAGYLPASVTEMWEPERDFAQVRIPRSRSGQPVKSVVAMAGSAPQVMVATSEGDFLVYNIDLEKGGEGVLVKSQSISERSESQSGMYAE